MDEPVQESEVLDPLAIFPKEIQKPIEGLAYLGELTDTANFCGHTFGLRTLRPAHRFAIAQALQPYRNTIHEVDVYQALHVGMALTEIDGDSDFCPPIGPDIVGFAKARLNFLTNDQTGWYPPTIEFLWGRYIALEAVATRAIQELDRLSQRSQPTDSSPWLDSSLAQGTSPEETNSDIPPSMPFN